ncbi:zinc finger, C3HC4 type (RING finger) protein (macronuclear) [Tetrahymena thermophila SB210]|uniref:Zinc finger, C3HC4 type (RING finger) protein n=1 Tax=Tetrahymena thermophila (strain SB210) TaxID=312017 RepID=I7MAT7_TETTS|nr:zinc finger, C3HC4 type (RING finger) protein [Tetrahymena thermophila SB210]EAS06123.1 zinc finger, C3HC4 type (RING finger) protein [Tetrahymena thermophila SB210]|eukprot:XP_001026368.1 zinc finger, C3HC4 type (RING finger) protein [Tetrahymena thermophila SB210]
MDIISSDNNQYFCETCQMYIQTSLQPIHSTFCQGVSPQDINLYSDSQVYELSRMMQEYNLFDYYLSLDFKTNSTNQRYIFEDYFPDDTDQIDTQSQTPPSLPNQTQQQFSNNQSQFSQQNNSQQQFQQPQIKVTGGNFQGNQNQAQTQRQLQTNQESNTSRQNTYQAQYNRNNSSQLQSQQVNAPQRLCQAIQGQYKTPVVSQNSCQKQGNQTNYLSGNPCNLTKQQTQNQNYEDNFDDTYQCHQCYDYVKISDYSTHQAECRNQYIKCKYCNSFYPFSLINQHVLFCQKQNNQMQQQQSSSIRSQKKLNNQNTQTKNNGYDTDDFEDNRDIDEHNSADYNNSVYENLSLYGTSQFNMEERSLANRQRQYQQSSSNLQTQQSTLSNFNNQSNIATENNQNQNQNPNDWTQLSPDYFNRALNVIFPSFLGDQDDFRRQQNEQFRNNLITRLINISRFGINGDNCRGLTSNQKNKFIKVNYKQKQQSEYKTCSICMCDYEEDEEINILDCMHRYHVECISKWFQSRTTCPVCKRDMSDYLL